MHYFVLFQTGCFIIPLEYKNLPVSLCFDNNEQCNAVRHFENQILFLTNSKDRDWDIVQCNACNVSYTFYCYRGEV